MPARTEKLLIKNMVCTCCIRLVREDLSKFGLSVIEVRLGEAVVKYDPELIPKSNIVEVLEQLGLEIIEDKDEVLVEEIKRAVIDLVHHMNNVNSVVRKSEYLVEKLGRSYQTLSKIFSKLEPVTLEKYIILQKIEKVKELALDDRFTLSEIAWMMDYSSPHHLSNQFKNFVGVSLSDYKKNPVPYKKSISQLY